MQTRPNAARLRCSPLAARSRINDYLHRDALTVPLWYTTFRASKRIVWKATRTIGTYVLINQTRHHLHLSIFSLADVAGLQVKIYDFFGDSTVAKDLADLTEQQGVVRLRFHHGAHDVCVCVGGPCNLRAPAGSCLGVLPLHDRIPAQASHRPRLVPSLCAQEHWRRRVHGRDGAARPLHLPRVESKCVAPLRSTSMGRWLTKSGT